MTDLLFDLKYGIRSLFKARGFAAAAILALGLGIGASTAIFSVVNGVVLRPLPYADPDRLVNLWEVNHEKNLDHEPLSPVNFMDYRDLPQVFADAAAWWRPEVTLRDQAREPVRVNTIEVSGNFLSVMGVRPALGAGFPDGVFDSRERVVVISHRLWESRFAANASIVGTTIRLNDDDHTIAGVMPAGFNFPGDTDVWQRLTWDLRRHSRGAHFMEAVARMKPGTTSSDVQRELDALTTRLAGEFAATNNGWRARVVPLHEEIVGYFRSALYILLAAVGLLLLIACINIAGLLMARAASRAREVAVRAAIGASRLRLVRQFLTESAILGIAGGALGVALAFGATKAIVLATPIDVPRLAQVGLDARALLFAMLLSIATAIVFGLLPALLMSRADLQRALKEGARGQGGPSGRRAHHTLVAAEIALAVVLLAGAGLLVRGVLRVTREDPGFRADNVLTAGIQLSGAAYRTWPQVEQFHTALVEAVRQQPGVQAAGASNFLPLSAGWRVRFVPRTASESAARAGDEPTAQYHSVSEGYFEALGVRLVRGRLFDAHDTAQSRGVVVINESLARRYFRDEDPVGKTIESRARGIGPLGASLMKPPEQIVIGVVRDVKNSSLQSVTEPAMYFSTRQFPFRHLYLAARGEDAQRVGAAIRTALRQLDPGQPMPELRTLESVVGASMEVPRLLMFLLGVFAASALALAALGIYGLLSYAVAERHQELSIRLALGARPGGVRWLVVRDGMRLAIAGCIAGVCVAYVAARQIASVLYGVSPGDPIAFSGVVLVALATASIACALPAIRASRIEPLEGLKE
ncbi:MAG TPA: ABC transporter permease [Vicinamibacterales bacterium]